MAVSTEVLCKGWPAEFGLYLNYCRKLKFDESPDYMYLRQMFRFVFLSFSNAFSAIISAFSSEHSITNPTMSSIGPFTSKKWRKAANLPLLAPVVVDDDIFTKAVRLMLLDPPELPHTHILRSSL